MKLKHFISEILNLLVKSHLFYFLRLMELSEKKENIF